MSEPSSDEDNFENFLNQIRTPKPVTPKYRWSNGSLDDFFTNSSHSSNGTNSSCENLNENASKECVVSTNLLEELSGDTSATTSPSTGQVLGKLKNNKVNKRVKSVNTPVRKMIFSSASESDDDHLFLPKAKIPGANSFKPKSPNKDKFFKFRKPTSTLTSSSESDSDDLLPSLSGKQLLPCPLDALDNKENTIPHHSTLLDSDSEEECISLQARVLKGQLPTSAPSKLRGPSLGGAETPTRKPFKHPFQTEKIIRTSKQVCQVKGCFLSSLELSQPKNVGSGFKRCRVELTARLFKLFNASVFESKLPSELEVTWAKRLTKTAGITKCKRVTSTLKGDDGHMTISKQFQASISLSEKVIDCSSRLRDTLIHEMCHAAVWLLNNANESHGPFWKSWAAKARRIHPELPSIERCHNYEIEYKFVYQCTRCATEFGRHSKSIDTTKKVCGRCAGKLILQNRKLSNGSGKTRVPNPFAEFVKQNYKSTKSRLKSFEDSASHRDVMKSLSEQFKSASVS
ncbi:germ cell nuclear acidic protein-like [Clavelina lepadiformis]|uniref:germ cell nuclear acidic protein-like n=1 Tax=Clavelina lepadiformis TaxID=159417 RepID=UPI00404293DA